MILDFLRFFSISLNSLITYKKLANFKPVYTRLLFTIIGAIPISLLLCILHMYLPQIDFVVMILYIFFMFHHIYKIDYTTSFFIATFSIGINLLCFIAGAITSIPFIAFFTYLDSYKYSFSLAFTSRIIVFAMHTLIVYLIFKLKPFKKGMPFVNASKENYIGFFICLFAVIMYSLFGNEGADITIMSFLIIIGFIALIFFLFWWNDQNKRHYERSVITRQHTALENQLETLRTDITSLESQNETLGSIIHKDNKIVVAMTLAVEQLLATYPEDTNSASHLEKLKLLQEERSGYLHKKEQNTSLICDTGSIRIDSIVNYMNHKAKEKNIKMHFIQDISLEGLTPNKENDICTLIADATENAIIATAFAGKTDIKLDVKINPETVCLKIYDCGLPFEKKVIKVMGRRRYTTHKDTGGSGIGMMTTFDILRRYQTSYAIAETITDSIYTKCITITFDELYNITYNGKKVR